MLAGSGRCRYHPERPGIGVCVECRQVICRECSTPVEGINRCAQCLGKKRVGAPELRPRREWSFFNLVLAAASFGFVLGLLHLVTRFAQR